MDKTVKMAWLLDLIWLGVIAIMLVAWYVLLQGKVNIWIHLFFTYNIFIALLYAWWTVQVHQSPVVKSFWVKMPVIIGNIPLFFLLMKQADFFTKIFDAMYYIPVGETEAYISSAIEVESILFIRNSGIFWSVSAMVLTMLVALRFVFVVFKYKQIPLKSSHH